MIGPSGFVLWLLTCPIVFDVFRRDLAEERGQLVGDELSLDSRALDGALLGKDMVDSGRERRIRREKHQLDREAILQTTSIFIQKKQKQK